MTLASKKIESSLTSDELVMAVQDYARKHKIVPENAEIIKVEGRKTSILKAFLDPSSYGVKFSAEILLGTE